MFRRCDELERSRKADSPCRLNLVVAKLRVQIDDGDPAQFEAREVESAKQAVDGKPRVLNDAEAAVIVPPKDAMLLPMLPTGCLATSFKVSMDKSMKTKRDYRFLSCSEPRADSLFAILIVLHTTFDCTILRAYFSFGTFE